MTDSALITEKPSIRHKGFKDANLRIIPATPADQEVAARLRAVHDQHGYAELALADRQWFDRVMGAYDKRLAGETLAPEDFVLTGHELPEFKRTADRDVPRYAVYRYKYNKFPELKFADGFPPCLQIEPMSVCNFRCVMCYQADASFARKSSGHMGNMSLDMFKRAVDEAEGRVEAVTMASRVEPLLHPDIVDMLEYCRGKFLGLKLNTNASLLNERLIHALLSSDLQSLVFSIDAADKALYEKIRVNGKFDKLVANLELFRDIRAKHYGDRGPVVRVSGVKLNDRQDIDAMQDFWSDFADIVAFTNYNPWQDSYHNDENTMTAPCTELWRRIFVWWDGKLNPCDFDYKSTLSRWTFPEVSIGEAWMSGVYEELRRKHLAAERRTVEPCRRCIVN